MEGDVLMEGDYWVGSEILIWVLEILGGGIRGSLGEVGQGKKEE